MAVLKCRRQIDVEPSPRYTCTLVSLSLAVERGGVGRDITQISVQFWG
jgi:hypothetical protein